MSSMDVHFLPQGLCYHEVYSSRTCQGQILEQTQNRWTRTHVYVAAYLPIAVNLTYSAKGRWNSLHVSAVPFAWRGTTDTAA
jgi:hypothetical protein